jgi:ATP/maltotriose-dependent transcriptional regulator MalT
MVASAPILAVPILATKLYIPPRPPKVVVRTRLIERLNETASAGGTAGVTLISAPAGFGKTTLVSEWVASCDQPVAWLSLNFCIEKYSQKVTVYLPFWIDYL